LWVAQDLEGAVCVEQCALTVDQEGHDEQDERAHQHEIARDFGSVYAVLSHFFYNASLNRVFAMLVLYQIIIISKRENIIYS
jgi:hypothetical protein